MSHQALTWWELTYCSIFFGLLALFWTGCGDGETQFSLSKFEGLEKQMTTKQIRSVLGQPDKEYVATSKNSPYLTTVWVYGAERDDYFIYFVGGSLVEKKCKSRSQPATKDIEPS